MFKKSIIPILFLFATNHCLSQTVDNLHAINKVWEKFYKAFETLDYKPMAEIHSKDLIRISGGQRIIDYDTYINNYKTQFEQATSKKTTNHITLRFFERINNESIASERGIYRLTINKGKLDEQSYYGQFHVIMKKENDIWKITMDYDATEFDTISKEDYDKAHAITNLEVFIKN